ncbi:MAG: hypothetical protein AB1446_09870 [Bacillota bacterium]
MAGTGARSGEEEQSARIRWRKEGALASCRGSGWRGSPWLRGEDGRELLWAVEEFRLLAFLWLDE